MGLNNIAGAWRTAASAIGSRAAALVRAIVDSSPVRSIRLWSLGVRLHLIVAEIYDVNMDIVEDRTAAAASLIAGDENVALDRWLKAEGLTTYHARLVNERDYLVDRMSSLD